MCDVVDRPFVNVRRSETPSIGIRLNIRQFVDHFRELTVNFING